ncbi:MAG: bifunctional diguanylate cyclase/phosphodiesterase [Gammaproteobacteria bacterium SHHR-1]|uniref:putative bifunctional diguanylate cyclase/phosphodiesterase n=1 Tax=Magnetovirga frankeli TaxID=947516 RepID=UPI001294057C|nr:bifunctional diguanylate cyclase/phosphodiesterase [gamma proteobacterium SS-5]
MSQGRDPLTGLEDRQSFLQRLAEAVAEAEREASTLALLVLDIQRFQHINHSFGQALGDALLQAVTGVLGRVARRGDSLARIGSDRFAMLLPQLANEGHAQLAALKVQRLLEQPFILGQRRLRCNLRIGIGLYPAKADGAEALLRCAEQALAEARRLEQPIGLAPHRDEQGAAWNVELESQLEGSLERGEMRVFFQPKLDLSSGLPVGAEALIRWQNPSHGLLPPGQFLPLAETLGMMQPITLWMLNSALRHSASWTDKWGRLGVSVNIPPKLMDRPDFVDIVTSTERLWRQQALDLYLEVLEESMVSAQCLAHQNLSELRRLGVKISIDDFGAGYSSLSYFRDLPADELKIDRSFISGLQSDPANEHIVEVIIELAHRFGLSVTAEGVEQAGVLDHLRRLGCDQVQGYYITRPMPAESFADWLCTFQRTEG